MTLAFRVHKSEVDPVGISGFKAVWLADIDDCDGSVE
jgi:hypothetical protein